MLRNYVHVKFYEDGKWNWMPWNVIAHHLCGTSEFWVLPPFSVWLGPLDGKDEALNKLAEHGSGPMWFKRSKDTGKWGANIHRTPMVCAVGWESWDLEKLMEEVSVPFVTYFFTAEWNQAAIDLGIPDPTKKEWPVDAPVENVPVPQESDILWEWVYPRGVLPCTGGTVEMLLEESDGQQFIECRLHAPGTGTRIVVKRDGDWWVAEEQKDFSTYKTPFKKGALEMAWNWLDLRCKEAASK